MRVAKAMIGQRRGLRQRSLRHYDTVIRIRRPTAHSAA